MKQIVQNEITLKVEEFYKEDYYGDIEIGLRIAIEPYIVVRHAKITATEIVYRSISSKDDCNIFDSIDYFMLRYNDDIYYDICTLGDLGERDYILYDQLVKEVTKLLVKESI